MTNFVVLVPVMIETKSYYDTVIDKYKEDFLTI